MSNEAILVVDDAPVNLKLTGILLRKAGYDVHSAVDAEQALDLLQTFHPDLMLVDIQLPGMDGLELTRRLKQDERTRGIVVVALTACAMKGDDEKAFRAGCDGYITKPVDTGTLPGRIREYLDRRFAPPSVPVEPLPIEPVSVEPLPVEPVPVEPVSAEPPPQPVPVQPAPQPQRLPGGLSFTPAEIEGLRRRFLEDATLQVRHLMESLTRGFDVNSATRTCRDWAAAATILEYPTIAVLANEVERCLNAANPDPTSLHEALSNLMLALVETPESVSGPVPDSIVAALKGMRVALVGFPADDAERLCVALERASARPRYFDHVTPRDSDPLSEFSLVVVDVTPSTKNTFLLAAGPAAFSGPPLVLAGLRNQILSLDHSVQLRACELLIDGWQPEEALMRLALAFSRKHAPPVVAAPAPAATPVLNVAPQVPVNGSNGRTNSEVLVADDDMTVRLIVRSALENAGIKCRMASSGPEALQILRDCHPCAAVLDVNMPGMDGYEVLAAARLEAIPVKVLLLTARQQEADITRGFTLGADDYLIKPFNPPELVARLRRFLRPRTEP
jgi:CheY-like chemotaxis protein